MKRLLSLSLISAIFISPSAMAENPSQHQSTVGSTTPELLDLGSDSQVTFKYVCPMHPQIIRDHEGTCPICGMTLVKQAFEQNSGTPSVSVGSSSANGLKQGLAIRVTKVQKTTLWKYISTFGRITADESRVVHIHPRAAGWIKNLSVQSNGEKVKKGDILYRIYSPEIVSAQQDLLLAKQSMKRQGSRASNLMKSAKIRLQLLGVADSVIRIIEKRNRVINDIPVYAPKTGVVESLIVQNGMYVQPKTELMKIENYGTVWIEAEVLPLQQAWVKEGVTANITSIAYPDSRWESAIDYIYPTVDLKSQAMKVRLPVINSDRKLKANMLVEVELFAGPKKDVLAIPEQAIIDDGSEKRVVIRLPNGRFEVHKVETGMVTQDIVEIYSGVKEGDEIVVSGQFLIDSESQIQANLRRLITEPSK